MKTLIVTGGTLDIDFIRRYQEQNFFDLIIACDSGIRYFTETGTCPDEVVGDFDSASDEDLNRMDQWTQTKIHTYPVQKDATDTELAVLLALDRGASQIHIVGGTGTRLDHMLGTICVLGIPLERGVLAYLLDANNRVRLIDQKTVLTKDEQYGTYISLIPFTEKVTGVSLRGFQYPLENGTFSGYHSLGLSNVITEPQAVIDLKTGILILAEARD